MENISSLVKYLSSPSLSSWYWSSHDIGTSTKLTVIFFKRFLVCLLKKYELQYFVGKVPVSCVLVSGLCIRCWGVLTSVGVSGRPSAPSTHIPSACSIYAFSAVFLRCSELQLSLGSISLYFINAGRRIRLQIYLISLRLQQETETVKKQIRNVRVDGSHGGLTSTYVSGMLQL